MPLLYYYIGPPHLKDKVQAQYQGTPINQRSDIEAWIKKEKQQANDYGIIVATFVVLEHWQLYISDRHIEHVQCANKKPVLSAGEISFEFDKGKLQSICQITNQSTGYCPPTHSWEAVAQSLRGIELPHPDGFDPAYVFSYCPNCKSLKIVKNEDFVCWECGENLWGMEEFQMKRKKLENA